VKKILGCLCGLLFFVGTAQAGGQYIESLATTIYINQVEVSSVTATALYTGSADLAGRTKTCFQSVDGTYGVWLGTSSSVTATNGWYIGDKDNPNNSVCFPFGNNYTFYGLGETGQLTTNLAVIEIRQKN